MSHGESPRADIQIDAPRQLREPAPEIGGDLPICVSEPCGRQPFAEAAGRKSAPTIVSIVGELFVAISHHDMNACIAHKLDRRDQFAAIRSEVARAHDSIRGNPEPSRARQNRLCRLQIAIRSAEDDCRTVKLNEGDHGTVQDLVCRFGEAPEHVKRC